MVPMLELKAESYSYYEIARVTGTSRNPVRKYIVKKIGTLPREWRHL